MAYVLGFGIGSIPSIAMLFSSWAFSSIDIPRDIEAFFQNLSGGMIFAVLGTELFPLLNEGTRIERIVGVVIGFVIGLSLIFGATFIEPAYIIFNSVDYAPPLSTVNDEIRDNWYLAANRKLN